VFGNAHTHDRLIRELAVGANTAATRGAIGLANDGLRQGFSAQP
jgi:hypothetical protein